MLAVAAGLGLTAWLIASDDWAAIGRTIAGAGWAFALIPLLHLPQTLASAWSWRVLLGRSNVGIGASYNWRWVRDAINTLLPVAQVGGDVVRVRLLARGGGATADAATAATVTDVAVEVVAQIAFTMAAVPLLPTPGNGLSSTAAVLEWATSASCAVILIALVAAWRFGLLDRLARFAARRLAAQVDGGGETPAAVAPARVPPARLAACLGGHLVAWALGSVETWAALWVIGVPAGFGAAVVIEALGHGARAVGFFIPGALGVQEGGYVLVCGLYGIGSADALSLSIVKRLRELVLGVPGLMLWGWLERRAGGCMTKISSD